MLPFAAAAAAALPSLFQIGSGAVQTKRGKKLAAGNTRPTYTRPTEATQALALAENEYLNGGMPGSARLRSDIGSSTANSIDAAKEAATTSSDVIDALTKINYNEGQQLNDVATQEAAFKQQQLQDYKNQLATSAGYSDKEFAYNKDQPYQDTAAAASALIEGGNTNIGNGINGLASLGTTLALNSNARKATSTPAGKSMFTPLDAASAAPFNFTSKKMVFDPYNRKISTGF